MRPSTMHRNHLQKFSVVSCQMKNPTPAFRTPQPKTESRACGFQPRSAPPGLARWRAHSISEPTPLAGGRPIRAAHPVRHASRHAQRRTRT
jgi:hypothetical protein